MNKIELSCVRLDRLPDDSGYRLERYTLTSLVEAQKLGHQLLDHYDREIFMVIGLDYHQKITVVNPVVIGNINFAVISLRERLGGYIARFFYLGAMMSMWFLTPQIMQTQLHFTPLQAGLGFFPLTIVSFIVAVKVAKLTDRFGNTKLLIVGIILTVIGMFAISFFSAQVGYTVGIALPMILMGIGQGLTLSPLTVAGVANTLLEDSGAASGVVNMVHQIGGSVCMGYISSLCAS